MIDLGQLERECAAMGIETTVEQRQQMERYAQMLMEWNEKMNLTAIKKPEEIVTKHFVDSLTLLRAAEIPAGARLVDVGTGAGFPGVPVKIVRPDVQLTLLDSLNKRVRFLTELSAELGQQNACVHERAEEAGRQTAYRERFDWATARAVAHLRELCEYCLPLVRVGGWFAAMKSGEIDGEVNEARKAVQALGGKIERIERFTLPDDSARAIVLVKKISQTSPRFPRPQAKIAKSPLN